jgi:GT2 family glycosyltransferase
VIVSDTQVRTCDLSVVIATYNRTESLLRLLRLLATQTMSPARFEVVVVDDGSREPAAPALHALRASLPYRLHPIAQANGGPGAARNTGIEAASGDVIVIVDDDMRVSETFLDAHFSAHPMGSRRVVLGRLLPPPEATLPLFERYQMEMVNRLFEGVARGTEQIRGWNLYTGNVSFRRADYLAVGGFDRTLRLSEDAELGIRLEESGVAFTFSDDAACVNDTDHASLRAWMNRSLRYGESDSRIAAKHAGLLAASPWRFLHMVNPVSRPLLRAAVTAPAVLGAVAWAATSAATLLATLGLERAAIAGMTFGYGLQYFRGVRRFHGSASAASASLAAYNAARSRLRSATS